MKVFFLIAIALLTGCSTVPTVYNPNNINLEEMAVVKTSQNASLFGRGYNTWIEYVWDENNNEITGRSPFWDNMLGELSLPAGKYRFKAACVNGQYESHPEAFFRLAPKTRYEISCDIGKGKNLFGMSVDAFAKLKIREIKSLTNQADGTP
ncbi:MAG: hypothetical protein COB51_06665 [Moraxellaceae bacterium]|nr:MAG: hypothetical protein COB51_06665 [Moraxellaceae bacterium]